MPLKTNFFFFFFLLRLKDCPALPNLCLGSDLHLGLMGPQPPPVCSRFPSTQAVPLVSPTRLSSHLGICCSKARDEHRVREAPPGSATCEAPSLGGLRAITRMGHTEPHGRSNTSKSFY